MHINLNLINPVFLLIDTKPHQPQAINNIPPTSTKFVSYSSNQGWRRTTREKTEPQTHPTPLWMNPYPRGPRGTLVPRGQDGA